MGLSTHNLPCFTVLFYIPSLNLSPPPKLVHLPSFFPSCIPLRSSHWSLHPTTSSVGGEIGGLLVQGTARVESEPQLTLCQAPAVECTPKVHGRDATSTAPQSLSLLRTQNQKADFIPLPSPLQSRSLHRALCCPSSHLSPPQDPQSISAFMSSWLSYSNTILISLPISSL